MLLFALKTLLKYFLIVTVIHLTRVLYLIKTFLDGHIMKLFNYLHCKISGSFNSDCNILRYFLLLMDNRPKVEVNVRVMPVT